MGAYIEWLKHHLMTCPSKQFFRVDCPGCGLQRSIIALLEGDLATSLRLYPATLPMLFCLFYTALHLKFKFKHGAAIIKGAYIFTSLIIVIFYVYKVFTHQLI